MITTKIRWLKRSERSAYSLHTQNMYFSFNGDIQLQCSGVGPALTGIFMVELERKVVPQLSERMGPWERFVDHTITCNK